MKKLRPILEFYGPNTQLIRSYDLRKEPGATIAIGKCPESPCFRITLKGIEDTPNRGPSAQLSFDGVWPGTEWVPQAVVYALSLKRGCRITFEVPSYDVMFVIEDDRVSSLKAGIGISSAPSTRTGWRAADRKCPEN
jgi:hypothetical protein